MRVAITGSRDRRPGAEEFQAFLALYERLGGTELLHGDCRGTDQHVGRLAEKHGLVVTAVPVVHSVDGPWPGAGPRRNRRMLAKGAEALIAFQGNKGTRNCVATARLMGIPVYFVTT